MAYTQHIRFLNAYRVIIPTFVALLLAEYDVDRENEY